MYKKFLFCLIAPIFITVASYAQDSEDNPEYKVDVNQSDEDAKYQADSEMCYDDAEKKFKSDKKNKKLSDEQKEEKLDELYTGCMKSKGHNPEEEATDEGESSDSKEEKPSE